VLCCELKYQEIEDFAEAAEATNPISTVPVGSAHVREHCAKIADLRKKRTASKRGYFKQPGFTNLARKISETSIAKLDEI
jgi:hypothetical protein